MRVPKTWKHDRPHGKKQANERTVKRTESHTLLSFMVTTYARRRGRLFTGFSISINPLAFSDAVHPPRPVGQMAGRSGRRRGPRGRPARPVAKGSSLPPGGGRARFRRRCRRLLRMNTRRLTQLHRERVKRSPAACFPLSAVKSKKGSAADAAGIDFA